MWFWLPWPPGRPGRKLARCRKICSGWRPQDRRRRRPTRPFAIRSGRSPKSLWASDIFPDARARALTPEAMIETGYEIPTFIVLEQRPDGWLRFRYGRAESETAWVHSCALGPLTFTPWSEWLLSPTISPLRFRAEEPHSLHASPNGGVTATISGDYHLEPLEVRGTWMRVRLKQPSDFCTPEKTPKTTEGWIEWSSVALGPLVWYPSRGC
jgi:hypothetical protein